MRLFSRTATIDARTAADRIATESVIVVDVRQQTEWKTGHIEGALHIPLTQLSNRQHQLPSDKAIVTLCRSGHRSALAARTLTRAGHNVLNLRGGMNAWVARSGAVGREHAAQPLDRVGQLDTPLMQRILARQDGKQVAELAAGSAQETPVAGDPHQHLRDTKRHDLASLSVPQRCGTRSSAVQ